MLDRPVLRRKSKYGNVPTIIDGIRFSSKAEASRYQELLLLKRAGEILWLLRQVPFDLPGNIRYFLDFMIFWKDKTLTFEDVKNCKLGLRAGHDTPVSKVKRKMVEHLYGITIQIT